MFSIFRRVTACSAATALVITGIPLHSAAQSPQTVQKSPAANSGSAAVPNLTIDGGWPRAYTTAAGAQLLVYQPQVASWDGQKQMVAYGAVAYQKTGSDKPTLGTVKIETKTTVAIDNRLVRFTPLKVTEADFGKLDRDAVRDIIDAITDRIPDQERVIALDRVLAGIDRSQIMPKNVEGVKAEPPAIFFSTKPAVLVNFDGDPIWSPIKDNDLKFAVNTNWDVFQYAPSSVLYLRWEKTWLKATDAKGPWTAAGKLPASFSKLPADENWKDAKAALPGVPPPSTGIPRVFVSTVPAELLLLRGAPVYSKVAGAGQLMWVSNTESDLFRVGTTGRIYYLVAGRWFSADQFEGPWTFATQTLPPEFQKISLEHPRSRVLASIPGTQQAAEAVLLAQVPQTARVNKKTLQAPEVAYQGDPQFAAIEKTTVARATNTDKDIIKVGDLYYMCFQGVWFMGRSPNGPWQVTDSVPGQIYEIPVSSPAHNVTYVTVEKDDSDDEWVTFAAVAGYTGMMVAWGCAVWGTGWYYPPYWGWYGGYPYYYPFYPTYGYGARYNPWTGAYSRGMVAYGPYGGAGVGARYNPRTGTYARGAAAWGPYGARGVAEAYNPRTGTYARTSQGSNVYGSWGSTSVQRGDQWAQTSRVTNRATGTTTRVTQGSGGGSAITRNTPGPGGSGIARTGSGDVYAGHDGNVYRNQGGGWQKYDNGSWNDVTKPTGQQSAVTRAGGERTQTTATPRTDAATVDQLNRDRAARTEGNTRTRDAGTVRSGSSGATSRGSGGSYRAGGGMGGGMRGGGRRR